MMSCIISVESYSQSSQNAQTENSIGYLLLEQEKFEESKQHFLKAIELDSMQIEFYYNLANAQIETSEMKLAEGVYSMAKQRFPHESELYMFSGDVLQKQGKLKEAIGDYSMAIDLVNSDSLSQYLYLCYFNRGNSYLKLKNYKSAVINYDEVLKLFPNHFGSYANRGMAKFNTKNKKGACEDWSNAYSNGYKQVKIHIDKYCN